MSGVPLKLIIATGNPGKVKDFQSIFDRAELPIAVSPISEWGTMPEVEESASTFEGNARIKALAAREVLTEADVWVMADDSGLSVEALDCAPGVHSARFAGVGADDAANRTKLLSALSGVRETEREAAFYCNLCLVEPKGTIHHFEGECRGEIATEERGPNGFGYDALFRPQGRSQTWGEIDTAEKNRDNHRAKAAQSLIEFFLENLNFH